MPHLGRRLDADPLYPSKCITIGNHLVLFLRPLMVHQATAFRLIYYDVFHLIDNKSCGLTRSRLSAAFALFILFCRLVSYIRFFVLLHLNIGAKRTLLGWSSGHSFYNCQPVSKTQTHADTHNCTRLLFLNDGGRWR